MMKLISECLGSNELTVDFPGVSRGAAEFFTMMKTFVASHTVFNVKNVIISKLNYNIYDYVKILLHIFVIITHN